MADYDMDRFKSDFRGNDVRMALGLLTRLPFPEPDWSEDEDRPAARAAWAYPLAGLAVAILAVLFGFVLSWVGLPDQLVAGAILFVTVMATGAMHEDGLADCADGLWGGWETARRLEIMKDSRIGAYGVLALVFSLLLRWSALSFLIASGSWIWAVLAVAVLSRTSMTYVMDILPNARDSGLSHQTGRPEKPATQMAAGIAALIAFLGFGWNGLWLLFSAAAVVMIISRLAQVKIGGQTGDVLGATQQVAEVVLLMMLCTFV